MVQELQTIAFEVGQVLLHLRRRGAVKGSWQGTQFKANADLEAHRLWKERLQAQFPSIPIVSEEDRDSFQLANNFEFWLIDPIDGTASFAEGYPGFVTQAALIHNGQVVHSVVFAPALNLCYLASRGRGAILNGSAMTNPHPDRLKILIDNYPEPRGAALRAFLGLNMQNYIECGSIGLKICRVAEGVADLFVKNVPVKLWDLAPGHLVLTEVGGCLTDLRGRDIGYASMDTVNGVIATRARSTLKHVLNINWEV